MVLVLLLLMLELLLLLLLLQLLLLLLVQLFAHPLRDMTLRVLAQMVAPIEAFAAFAADFRLLARVDDRVQVQVLFPFETCAKRGILALSFKDHSGNSGFRQNIRREYRF